MFYIIIEVDSNYVLYSLTPILTDKILLIGQTKMSNNYFSIYRYDTKAT